MQPIENTIVTNSDAASTLQEESLPFSVVLAQDEANLEKAVKVRQSAYGRHVPELAKGLGKAELYDSEPGTAVLLAMSKLDSEPLGTMRIQTNRYSPLAMEQSVDLPEWLQGRRLGEATRLGVSRGAAGRLVKTALFKAYYEYCLQADVEWLVITARSPLDRQYEALLFQDVFADGEYRPMQHVGNLPHRVLAQRVASVESRWRAVGHPLYDFFFRTLHADIRVSDNGIGRGEIESPSYELQRMLAN